jgi:hypothetical protein
VGSSGHCVVWRDPRESSSSRRFGSHQRLDQNKPGKLRHMALSHPCFFFCNTLPQVVNRDRPGMEGNGEQTRKPPAGELPSKKKTQKNTSAPSGSPAQRSALPAQAVRGLRSESEAFLVAKQVRKEQNMGALVVETVNRFPATRGWRISVRPSLNIFIGLPCRPKTENNEAARKVGEYSRRGSGRCCPQGTRVAQSRTNPKEENNKTYQCSPYRGSVTLGGDPPPILLSGVGITLWSGARG